MIKADGLAAGKGVLVTGERAQAERFLTECLAGARFGEAGRRVVIEEHLEGEELSVIAVCDGSDAVLLPAARDFKRALDGDRGPNTGGMGAIAPVGLERRRDGRGARADRSPDARRDSRRAALPTAARSTAG